jgi:Arc/MetJ family transcription regulator
MRMTVEIDDDLLAKAQACTGLTKTSAIVPWP